VKNTQRKENHWVVVKLFHPRLRLKEVHSLKALRIETSRSWDSNGCLDKLRP